MSVCKPKVVVAMSGGVDSSVAAALLLRGGYEVVGCFMRLGSPGELIDEVVEGDDAAVGPSDVGAAPHGGRISIGRHGCCSINDAADAQAVAARLGIPFYVCNFKRDLGRIIEYFVGEYNAGRTPNPCVRCNEWLKFGTLHEYARQIGAAYVATGHHARVDRSDPGRPRLLRGRDREKDQSYVLFGARRATLREMLLPIGEFEKGRVRELAREFNLPVHEKPDSQEICFVPDNDYAGLLRRRAPGKVRPGPILDRSGTVLGEHEGHQHYTIGQRRGIRIALGYPVYVVDKDASANTITVGKKEELSCAGLRAGETNWLVEPAEARTAGDGWIECAVQIRSNAKAAPGRVRRMGEDALEARFDAPQSAVAPGQAAVCYDGDAVLCGGWITGAIHT